MLNEKKKKVPRNRALLLLILTISPSISSLYHPHPSLLHTIKTPKSLNLTPSRPVTLHYNQLTKRQVNHKPQTGADPALMCSTTIYQYTCNCTLFRTTDCGKIPPYFCSPQDLSSNFVNRPSRCRECRQKRSSRCRRFICRVLRRIIERLDGE
jgi:hypothetical protein